MQREGDAFAQLFDLHQNRVFSRAVGLTENAHDAEDVTAAAFFELWRKRRSVRVVDGSVLPWLLVTTVNLARNRRRSTMRYEKLLRAAPRHECVEGPDAESIETRRRLTESLARLAPVDGALFVLTSVEGYPITEAAEALGLRPATARVRLHRARARLRTELHDLDPRLRFAEGTSR
ncbi:RNA polymerase sigma factor [Schumannella soli]|uniref:RNA polymerase sigma factor n=2 Tax=Schumannella soli TaxID=2590779 RepID=A0A506YCL1_9MICO|nr:RNA polymerase sigma factor [Schumannella soli]